MTTVDTKLHNPMWDELGPYVTPRRWSRGGDSRELMFDHSRDRFDLCSRFAWTVTSPDTVEFVAKHLGSVAVDPMAGSGYWAYLLQQLGVNVAAYDKHPAGVGSPNKYHKDSSWIPVTAMDAACAVGRSAPQRSLLLSWPPYDDSTGADVLTRFTGSRLVYIGEGEGGCCGDDRMFKLLDDMWLRVAEHDPVQWCGMHDWVTVYDRRVRELTAPVLDGEVLAVAS